MINHLVKCPEVSQATRDEALRLKNIASRSEHDQYGSSPLRGRITHAEDIQESLPLSSLPYPVQGCALPLGPGFVMTPQHSLLPPSQEEPPSFVS
jgi:hypothetical protein